ncbi:BMA-CDK-4, isoform b [Aphelenchoides besseyi]|nr:BMA-CDK-4, isoform b [Aphelenchoides besseyi]
MSPSKRPRLGENLTRIANYDIHDELGRGAYGCVYLVTNIKTGLKFALKQITMKPADEGIPQSVMREISTLRALGNHDNITRGNGGPNTLNVVFEKCDCDLAEFVCKQTEDLPVEQIRDIIKEIFKGLDFLHINSYIHRDIKPQNILMKNGRVKIADFGLSRNYGLHTTFSPEVVTLWYRSPELLLQCKYNTAVDIWSVGCIFAELYNREALFPAPSEAKLLRMIFEKIGTPDKERWPADAVIEHRSFDKRSPIPFSKLVARMSKEAVDLLQSTLEFNSERRATAFECLSHPYFTGPPDDPVLPNTVN